MEIKRSLHLANDFTRANSRHGLHFRSLHFELPYGHWITTAWMNQVWDGVGHGML